MGISPRDSADLEKKIIARRRRRVEETEGCVGNKFVYTRDDRACALSGANPVKADGTTSACAKGSAEMEICYEERINRLQMLDGHAYMFGFKCFFQ